MVKRTVALSALKRSLVANLILLTLVGGVSLWSMWHSDRQLKTTVSSLLGHFGNIQRIHGLLHALDDREADMTAQDWSDPAARADFRNDLQAAASLLSVESPLNAPRVDEIIHKIAASPDAPEVLRASRRALETISSEHLAFIRKEMEADAQKAISSNQIFVPAVTVGVICGCLSALIAITFALSRIQKPMKELRQFVSAAAERDLTSSLNVRSDDEFGEVAEAAVRLNGTLTQTIQTLGGVSEELARRGGALTQGANMARRQAESQLGLSEDGTRKVEEISSVLIPLVSVSQQLGNGSSQSAASIQQIVASARQVQREMEDLSRQSGAAGIAVEELEAAALRIADLAGSVGKAARSVEHSTQAIEQASGLLRREAAEGKTITQGVVGESVEGTRAMEEAIRAMTRIQEAVALSVESFAMLDAELAKIDRVTLVIEDIAGRTNLLSLNAAIIASQAGEHGHAFGVVASEIRALAEKTAISTKEIQSIVKGVAEGGRMASLGISTGVSRVAEGEREVRKTAELLEKIHLRAEESARRLQQIDAAAQGQSSEASVVAGEIRQVTSGVADIVSEVQAHGAKAGEIRRSFLSVEESARQTLIAVSEQVRGASLIADTIEDVRRASEEVRISIERVDELLKTLRRDMTTFDLGAREELERTKSLERDGSEMAELSGRLRAEIDTFRLPGAA